MMQRVCIHSMYLLGFRLYLHNNPSRLLACVAQNNAQFRILKGIHYQKGAKANNAQEREKDGAAKGKGVTGRMRGRGGQRKEEEGKEGRKHR